MDMRRLAGQNVRRIRLEKGLTQEQFSDISGFSSNI
jgi:transcriptional regulator with XRE-family HTH domain